MADLVTAAAGGSDTMRRRLLGAARDMFDALGKRIKFAESLLDLGATSAAHGSEAARCLGKVGKLAKQRRGAEQELAEWRRGRGTAAGLAAENQRRLEAMLTGGVGNPTLHGNNTSVVAGNPMLQRGNPMLQRGNPMLQSGNPMLHSGNPMAGLVRRGSVTGSQPVVVRSAVQEARSTALFVSELRFLRDFQATAARQAAMLEERRRRGLDATSDEDDSLAEASDEDEDDGDGDGDGHLDRAGRKGKPQRASDDESDDEDGDDESSASASDEDEIDGVGDDDGADAQVGFSSGQADDDSSLDRSTLRSPVRLRLVDMTTAMRRKLGKPLKQGGGHFVFGGSLRGAMRKEAPLEALW
jgi:hypothetical protein